MNDFTDLLLHFASDSDFANFRDEIREKYDDKAVSVRRHKVDQSGTVGCFRCFTGLVAEIHGAAYSGYKAARIDNSDRVETMRQSILLAVKANNVPVTGDLWLTLAFRTEAELIGMCRELNIQVPRKAIA